MWKENLYSTPWPHLVIDNFFHNESWEYVKNKEGLFKKYKQSAQKKNHGVSFSFIQDEYLIEYFSQKLSIEYLCSKFPVHRDFSHLDPSLSFKVSRIPRASSIHDEVSDKVFSVIVFVEPEHNIGTVLFDKDKNFNKVVTWKPNRAVVFAPIDNTTWHAFGNWERSDRYTIDFFWLREI